MARLTWYFMKIAWTNGLFPIKYKEYNFVMKAIPTGLLMLMRSPMLSYNICWSEPILCLNRVDINSKKCTDTIFYKNRFICLEGFFSGMFASQTLCGKKACSLPYRLCISNKLRKSFITFILVIILCQNVWILLETAHFVQINQKNWYIVFMNVTIQSFGETYHHA